jgi:hypothetical protein
MVTDGIVEHNHLTRGVKPLGECPACDRHHLACKARSLFDATTMWPNAAPMWHTVRDPHVIANIRASFIAAVLLDRDEDLVWLAEHDWKPEYQAAALDGLRRLARSVTSQPEGTTP